MADFETFRDHLLSIYQSAVTDIAVQIDEKGKKSGQRVRSATSRDSINTLPGIAAEIAAEEFRSRRGLSKPWQPRRRVLTKGEIGRVCAELALRYLKARLSNDADAIAKLNDEFIAGTCDPAWGRTIEEYLKYFGPDGQRKAILYLRPAMVGPNVIEIKPNTKVALAGDWGTGAQPAIQLLKQIAEKKPDIFVHLGDIYYSGTPQECRSNFLEPVNRILRNGRDPLVYTLSGNHDMYCGGVGYYDLIKEVNPKPYTQPASYFCLRTTDERWQFLAMDTGLHDYSPLSVSDAFTYLEPDELEWHRDRIREFPGRTILLSHHQLFSAYSAIGEAKDGKRSALNPKLYEAFKVMAQSGKISAWFWGHEHTLSIYGPFVGLQRGRCLGHGAVPTSIAEKIYEPVKGLEKVPTEMAGVRLAQVGGVYAHGYAMLSLDGDVCSAAYYQDIGSRKLIFEERLD